MKYLIHPAKSDPFYTNWFDVENNYNAGDVVFNLLNHTYTVDGKEWYEIEFDNL